MIKKIKISKNPTKNWENDHLQFARLLAEIYATQPIKITQGLMDSMDLSAYQINEIFDRAQAAWDSVVAGT